MTPVILIDTFTSVEAMYVNDERRRRSGEMDFGACWRERVKTLADCWRISFIHDTHEFYANNARTNETRILGRLPADLGDNAPYDVAEGILAMWEDAIWTEGLPWAKHRIEMSCAAAWRDVESLPDGERERDPDEYSMDAEAHDEGRAFERENEEPNPYHGTDSDE